MRVTGTGMDAGHRFRICHLRDTAFRAQRHPGSRRAYRSVPEAGHRRLRYAIEVSVQKPARDSRHRQSTRTEARDACGDSEIRGRTRVTVAIAVETRDIRP